MRARISLVLTTLVTVFLIEGQRVFFGSLFGLVSDALFPTLRPGAVLLVMVPVLPLLLLLIPFSRRVARAPLVAASATAAGLARLAVLAPPFPVRAAASAVTIVAAGLFLANAVGELERRSVAAGVAGGILLDQLLRWAGHTRDLTLAPGWLVPQVGTSLIVGLLAYAWLRVRPTEHEAGLERRTGGLRLRGAVALGIILFLESNVLAVPAVAAHWAGIDLRLTRAALALASAAAVLRLLTGGGTARFYRRRLLLMAILAALPAILFAGRVSGILLAAAFVAAHASALLLLGRALAPASGRRGGWTVLATLAILLALDLLFGLTFFSAYTIAAMHGAAPWIFSGAALLLTAALILLPRPARSAPLLGRGAALALFLTCAAAAGAWLFHGREAAPRLPPADAHAPVRVATFNVHLGFDEEWRQDPEAIARAIEATGADLVALQEVPVGLVMAYNIDLGSWLADRLGMRVYYAPIVHGLLGSAFLTRLPATGFRAWLLPGGPGRAGAVEPKALLRLELPGDRDTLPAYTVRLGLTPGERGAEVAAMLRHISPGPAVLLGDLNAGDGSAVAAALAAAGFVDAFRLAGLPAPPTAPARRPARRIDWIWVRGLTARDPRVLPMAASDHRPVAATVLLR